MSKEEKEYKFSGKVVRCTYDTPDFRIFALDVDSKKYPDIKKNKYNNVTILGELHELTVGVTYEISAVEQLGKYGMSYKVLNIKRDVPTTEEDMYLFLSEILTPNQAKVLYENYPDIVQRVKENRLDDIDFNKLKGIKEYTFGVIKRKIIENFCLADLVVEFQGFLNLSMIKKIYAKYTSIEKLKEKLAQDPYKCLCGLAGVGFKTADGILLDMEKASNHVPDSIGIEDEEAKYHTEAYKYAMEMLEKEGSQSAQGLYHNLNTLESRQGSQVPFTSINLGRDTTPEGRMVTRWMLEASIDGIGKFHLTSIFPISIFQYKVGCNANKEDANYDLKQLALESMSKRIYPNWCNCDWSQAHEDEDNPDTYFSTMGCRTLVGYDRHGLGYIRQGRGNNVPNTIILPKLGIEFGTCLGKRTEPDLKGFWDAFEETLKLCEKGLLERFEIMIEQSPKAAPFMYQNNTIQDAKECKESVYNALKHNTLAIGYIGVAEMCVALFGKNHAEDKKVHEFALSVVKRINEFAAEASERNDLNFSCYATPKTKRSVGAFTVM